MQINKQKSFAYMVCHKNEKGFTLIHTLFMLSIILLTIPFLNHMLTFSKPNTYHEQLSVNEFYRFIRDELIESSSFSVVNNRLLLVQGVDSISINQYEELVRRQVNGRGHEVYLRDVANFEVEESQFGVIVIITSTKGQMYEKKLVFYD